MYKCHDNISLCVQISSSAGVISELQGQLVQSNSKLTNQIKVTKEMEAQVASLQSESEQLHSSLYLQREKAEVMQGERVGLDAELASLRAECDKLREGLAGLKEFSDQRLQQEVDSLRADLERKEVELSQSCDSHMTSCSATLDDLESLRTANLLLQQEVRWVCRGEGEGCVHSGGIDYTFYSPIHTNQLVLCRPSVQ